MFRINVNPTGDDFHGNGDEATPIATASRARDIIRLLLLAGVTEDIEVLFAPGTYRQLSTITFNNAQDNTNSSQQRIFWRARTLGTVVITGNFLATGWKVSSGAIWQASSPGLECRSIFVNGVRSTYAAHASVGDTLTLTGTGYTSGSTSELNGTANPTGIEFVYENHGGGFLPWFNQPRNRVTSVSGTTITMNVASHSFITVDPGVAWVGGGNAGDGKPSFIENVWEDFVGNAVVGTFSWKSNVLYYVPRLTEDLSTAVVEVPMVQRLFDFRGCRGHNFQNLVLSGTDFPATSGFPEIADGDYVTGLGPVYTVYNPANASIPEAIRFHGCEDCHVSTCLFEMCNGWGVGIEISSHVTVVGNKFDKMGGGCVRPSQIHEFFGKSVTRNVVIAHNYMSGSDIFAASPAIWASCGTSILIENNLIESFEYVGIGFGYGLDFITPSNTNRLEIRNNIVRDVMRHLTDGGGISGQAGCNGVVIKNNLIYASSFDGFFFDAASANFLVQNNMTFFCNNNTIRFNQSGGHNQLIGNYTDTANTSGLVGTDSETGQTVLTSAAVLALARTRNLGPGIPFRTLHGEAAL